MPKGNVGVGIGVTGEKEFRQAVSAINSELKVLSSAMGKTKAEFEGQEDSMEALTATGRQLQEQYDAQAKKVETLKAALANAKEEFGENSKQAQNWQISLNKAEAELIKTGRTIEQNEGKIQALEEAMKAAAEETNDTGEKFKGLKKKLKDLDEAAKKSKDNWASFAKGLASAAGAVVKAAGAFGSAAISGITAAAENTREYRTELAMLATNAEATGNSVTIMEDKLKEVSTITGDSGAAVEGLSNILQTGFSQSAVDSITDTLVGASIKWKDTLKFEGLADGLQETLATGAATGSFGEMLERLGMNLDDFNAGLAACNDSASKQQYILQTLSATGLADLKESYEETNKDILDSARAQYDLNDALANLGAAAEPAIAGVKGQLAEMLGIITEGFASGGFGGLSGAVTEALTMAVNSISTYLPQVVSLGTDIIMSLANAITDNLPLLLDAAINIIGTLFNGLVDLLPQLIDAALQMVMTLAQGITEALPELVPTLVDAVLYVVDTLVNNVDQLIDAALAIVVALGEGIMYALPELLGKVPEIIVKLVGALIESAPKLWGSAVAIIGELAGGLIMSIPRLLVAIPTIIGEMVGAFKNRRSNFLEVGKNMIEGLFEGVRSMGSWLKNRMGDWIDDMIESVKDSLGIASPSKVFAQIGGYMAQGLGQGFEREMQKVDRQINAAVPHELESPGLTRYGSRGGVTVVQYNTYQSPKALSPAESARQTRLATQRAALALQGG